MGRLITVKDSEMGTYLNKWFELRFKSNKNVLITTLGSTGSGKSYYDLSILSLWYQYNFKKPFPIENVCFSLLDIMKRLNSKELKKGEFLIMEEAGCNLGSLDFQNKLKKLFTYVLQSFRSLNIGIIFNLPNLGMLNKSARLLLHGHLEMMGIDFIKKIAKAKLFHYQVRQSTGKIYQKFPQVKVNGSKRQIKGLNYPIPPKELVKEYELKKFKFVTGFNESFLQELKKEEKNEEMKNARKDLTEAQMETYKLLQKGLNNAEIAKIRGVHPTAVWQCVKIIKKKGYRVEFTKENEV